MNVAQRRRHPLPRPTPTDGSITELVRLYRLPVPIYVTRPTMPSLADYVTQLEEIWESRNLTNGGTFHGRLETELAQFLGVRHLSLFCNGTTALLVALQALGINHGEVITTPFTFPATVHALYWNHLRPVFCDIDETTFHLDPEKVEQLITDDTRAILPVHVFGLPCNVESLKRIAQRHALPLIYDAAHVFGVRKEGQSLVSWGDMSILSFHATKLFSTLEGGAVISSSLRLKQQVDMLRNFGILNEESVGAPGLNGKMNELQAAYGVLQLPMIEDEIANRSAIYRIYRERLKKIDGLSILPMPTDIEPNYSHFPILVDSTAFGMSRDVLAILLRKLNVFARKYFYPLCSRYPFYASLPSADPDSLPVAERVAQQVLCLPIYGTLSIETAAAICDILERLSATTLTEP